MHAVKNLFIAESMLQPLIIEIEDLHWIDNDSLKLVETMLRGIEDYPIFMVATSRYHDDGSKPLLIKDLTGFQNLSGLVHELNLNHLSDEDLQALIETELDAKIHADLFDFLKSKTQGNPFFTQQMIRYMVEYDFLETKFSGKNAVSEELLTLKESARMEMPSQLNALLIARLDRLSRDLKEVVQTASVIGREFQVDILMRVLKDISMIQIEKGEHEQVWMAISELQYIFKHVLLRDAAYEMQLNARLKVLHYMVADAIETMHAEDLSEKYADLAFHFDKAEIMDKAIDYYEKAGDHAKENFHNDESIFFYDRLLANLDLTPPQPSPSNEREQLPLVDGGLRGAKSPLSVNGES